MRRIQLIIFITSIISSSAQACYESSITSPQPFMGNHGEIFKLADGSIWEINYEYEYLYEYYPDVVACPDKNFIVLNSKKLNATQLSGTGSSGGGGAGSSGVTVIESKIDGDSEGFEGDTIFKLMNGQIWQQIDGKYKYKYKFMPKVTIISSGNSGKMSIEGIDTTIRVMRIR